MGIAAFILGILALIGAFTGMAPIAIGIVGAVLGITGIILGSYVGLSWIGLILSIIAIGVVYFGVAGRPTLGTRV